MQPLQCRTMARTTTIMSMARDSVAMTAAWRLRRHVLWHEQRRTTSKKAMRSNKVLQRVLENPETRGAFVNAISAILDDLKNNEKSNSTNE